MDDNETRRDHLCFLDSGCNNHLCGKRELFSQFDNNFREQVKLGNNTREMQYSNGDKWNHIGDY